MTKCKVDEECKKSPLVGNVGADGADRKIIKYL